MHVLQIPSWFPRNDNPYHGDFIYDFFLSLNRYGTEDFQYGVLLAESYQYRYKNLIKPSRSLPLPESFHLVENKGKYVPLKSQFGLKWYGRQCQHLFNKYVDQFGVPDLIHAHIYPAALAVRHFPYQGKVIYSEQSSALLSERAGDQKSVKSIFQAAGTADCTVAISTRMREKLAPYSKQLVKLFNPVEPEDFLPHADKSSHPFRWVSTGFFLEHKGFQEVITAFNHILKTHHLKKEVPELHLIGDGPYRARLEQLTHDLGISDHVFFRGAWPKRQLALELGQFNAYVMGSHYEPFGIVVPEALSCGLPVVATRSGGPDDVITEKYLGRLIAPKSPEKMATAMEEVMNDYPLFDSEKIRTYIIKHYSQAQFVGKIETLYRQLIQT